jgi:hypothetical protein
MDAANVITKIALAAWLAQAIGSTIAVAGYRRGLSQQEAPVREPPVAVILPVRGADGLPEFLRLLGLQTYDQYRIIAAVDSVDDPAYAILSSAVAELRPPLTVVVAGPVVDAGQKVWNQLAALDHLTEADEIVAFIDADTRPSPQWLPQLIAVLVNSGRPVATGYRWMVPADGRASSIALAAANNSIASLPRSPLPMPLVWGGSVAIGRATLDAIRLRDFWTGAISDDGQMTEALRAAGLVADAPLHGLLLTPVSASWREAFQFGVRQYRFVLMHQPRSWLAAFAVLWVPPIGIAAAAPALLAGHGTTWTVLALVVALGEIRTRLRRSLQRVLWPEVEGPRENIRWSIERVLRPVWWLLHATAATGALASRRIDWAGVRYRVEAPQRVVIERRDTRRAK